MSFLFSHEITFIENLYKRYQHRHQQLKLKLNLTSNSKPTRNAKMNSRKVKGLLKIKFIVHSGLRGVRSTNSVQYVLEFSNF